MPATGPVLILTDQPVIAALVGLQLEVIGREPVFADVGESPTEAIQRVRPVMVVMIDVALEAAQSDLFFAIASRRGVGIVVFGADHYGRQIAEIAAARRVPWFVMPPDLADLSVAMDAALGKVEQPRFTERRAEPRATVTPDGAHLLHDASGGRWMVYDRRGGAPGGPPRHRVFVNTSGVTRVYALQRDEEAQASAAALQRQLEGAGTES